MKSQRQAVRDYLRTGKTQRSSNFHIIDGHVFSYGWYKLAEIGYDTITLRKGPLYSPSTKRQIMKPPTEETRPCEAAARLQTSTAMAKERRTPTRSMMRPCST